jgi:hypothetical protein
MKTYKLNFRRKIGDMEKYWVPCTYFSVSSVDLNYWKATCSGSCLPYGNMRTEAVNLYLLFLLD